ncbi:PepSY-associated TM helix domain-containing protein [Rhodoplanes sp. Z2-YC6860]|uniref:PepSY-associated TM helix domain-containing protein n=1 Tax=Rhodoplanes sp. Z2-YC6860 TaxID=674703 RepID=UPI00078C4BCD|nr:PepSY domain-containing protein [Rhodoplanes sp. Z2-YC6860]AMN39397.1 PepSY-associated TM helix domain-containing protein [Rhodoplanes sp. Z2-YC6860]
MNTRTIRRWSWVHKWTSLVCTAFLLMLCITGLPLIFKDEIDELLHEEVAAAEVPAGTPKADLDRVVAAGLAQHPGQVVQFLIWDRDEPDKVTLSVGKSYDSDPTKNVFVHVDAHTGTYLDSPDVTHRLTYILLKLHTDMFADLPGKLFLGLMGLLFVVAIVSGVVVYAPSMRKLEFGTVRRHRPRRVRWLDLHNLLGVVTVGWALAVGFTGVVNTWADVILKIWQFGQLAEMTGPFKGMPVPQNLHSIEAVVQTAKREVPGMIPFFVAYPGTPFTSTAHFAVFMRGDTPLTSRLLKPALINAATGEFTDSRDLPWYVTALLVSQPLHFGDYGGMPLKIIWAVLDIITIMVLGSGLYLWLWRAPRVRREPAAEIAAPSYGPSA